MKKEDIEKILYEADYYIYGNKTLKEIAKDLNISLRTLQIHFNEKLPLISSSKYEQLKKHQEELTKKKLSLGGKKGVKKSSYDIKIIELIADELISYYSYADLNSDSFFTLTLRELSKKYQIPMSTLADNFKRLDLTRKNRLKEIFEYNKKLGKYKK